MVKIVLFVVLVCCVTSACVDPALIDWAAKKCLLPGDETGFKHCKEKK